MKRKSLVPLLCLMVSALLTFAQSADHLSPDEVNAAVSAKSGTGIATIVDMGFRASQSCVAQSPASPVGWLNSLSMGARKQYLQFEPKPEDTLRALTIISQGCANGSPAGPVCDSITRVALLSDIKGKVVVEAIASHPVSRSWQNGFGATAVCTSLLSKFSLSDVQNVQNNKGEFLVATFGGSQLLKTYTVKEKYIKKLGL